MPKNPRPPAYRLHKARQSAVVTIDGRNFYLGAYGSPESKEKYARLIAEQAANPSTTPSLEAAKPVNTVSDVLLAYLDHARGYYVNADGTPNAEYGWCKAAAQVVLDLYASLNVNEFGPLKLQAVRETMIGKTIGHRKNKKAKTWSRPYVNACIGRIKRMFKWAAAQELAPVEVSHGLACVPGLRRGKSKARETAPVRPVSQEAIDATLPHLGAIVRAMVELQALTGCRAGELVIMRPMDVDRSRETWCYSPSRHKTQNHGDERRIYLGPQARAILAPFLLRSSEAFCFSPAESEEQRKRTLRENRRSKVQPSQSDRRKAKPQRKPRESYDTGSYRVAIARACRKAGIEPWQPHQLRHALATRVRETFDLEASQTVLGHSDPKVTLRYAERSFAKAIAVMESVG